jgi:hypothetical protein
MAHFAKLDSNNIVQRVVVINNAVLMNGDLESEQKGINFLVSLFGGLTSEWVQTSYNNNFRKQFSGIGYTYDLTNDVFIVPKPYNSWTLNLDFDWLPPNPYPSDNKTYNWNEETQSWDLFTPLKHFDSWIWNETEWAWNPPLPYPTDGQNYHWNEENQTWYIVE